MVQPLQESRTIQYVFLIFDQEVCKTCNVSTISLVYTVLNYVIELDEIRWYEQFKGLELPNMKRVCGARVELPPLHKLASIRNHGLWSCQEPENCSDSLDKECVAENRNA